uniref:Uncharacterized protein n=1 Tax=Aegilops tauschii subsp. strangulata TaxID=200361 RepID=A0A453CAV8_AEGTS
SSLRPEPQEGRPSPCPIFSFTLSALSPSPVITRGRTRRTKGGRKKGSPLHSASSSAPRGSNLVPGPAIDDGEEPGVQGDAAGAAGLVLRRPRRRGGRRHEWHAARLASLNKTHTLTWEEFKKKQKDEELKRGEVEADKDKMMREYRAQLDAERAQKLGRGRDVVKSKSSSSKKEKKEKDAKKRIKKRRKVLLSNTNVIIGHIMMNGKHQKYPLYK